MDHILCKSVMKSNTPQTTRPDGRNCVSPGLRLIGGLIAARLRLPPLVGSWWPALRRPL